MHAKTPSTVAGPQAGSVALIGAQPRSMSAGSGCRPMMYGESDAAAATGNTVRTACGPRRWCAPSRAGTTPADAASTRSPSSARRSAPALRDDRPRGVLRLPVHAAAGQAGRRPGPRRSSGPTSRSSRRGSRARRATCAAGRPRAVDALAHVLPRRSSSSPRRSASSWSSRSARCWPTCPHTRPVSVTGLASDAALVERLGLTPSTYEGPTGHRRRAARRLPGRRPAVGQPVGRGAALRRRRAEPEGRAGAGAQARGPGRRHGRRHRARGGGRRLRAPGQPAPCRATPTCRRSSSGSSRPPPTRSDEPPTRSPRAT